MNRRLRPSPNQASSDAHLFSFDHALPSSLGKRFSVLALRSLLGVSEVDQGALHETSPVLDFSRAPSVSQPATRDSTLPRKTRSLASWKTADLRRSPGGVAGKLTPPRVSLFQRPTRAPVRRRLHIPRPERETCRVWETSGEVRENTPLLWCRAHLSGGAGCGTCLALVAGDGSR